LVAVLFAARRHPNADPSSLPTALLTASGMQPLAAPSAAALPAVAPMLDTARTAAPLTSAPPPSGAHKALPVVPRPPLHPPPPVFEKAQAKSLLGGDNPFDRRH
jgi:hypothetical protein